MWCHFINVTAAAGLWQSCSCNLISPPWRKWIQVWMVMKRLSFHPCGKPYEGAVCRGCCLSLPLHCNWSDSMCVLTVHVTAVWIHHVQNGRIWLPRPHIRCIFWMRKANWREAGRQTGWNTLSNPQEGIWNPHSTPREGEFHQMKKHLDV